MRTYNFLLAMLIFVAACSDNNRGSGTEIAGCGDPPEPVEYTVTEYEISYEHFATGELLEEMSPSDFVIDIRSEYDSYVAHKKKFKGITFSIFETAFACTMIVEQIPTQSVISFTVTSTGSFGEDYPSGANLTELFLVLESSPLEIARSEVEKPIQNRKMLLNSVPEDRSHIFTVTIELDDGLFVSHTSEAVVFNMENE